MRQEINMSPLNPRSSIGQMATSPTFTSSTYQNNCLHSQTPEAQHSRSVQASTYKNVAVGSAEISPQTSKNGTLIESSNQHQFKRVVIVEDNFIGSTPHKTQNYGTNGLVDYSNNPSPVSRKQENYDFKNLVIRSYAHGTSTVETYRNQQIDIEVANENKMTKNDEGKFDMNTFSEIRVGLAESGGRGAELARAPAGARDSLPAAPDNLDN